MNSSSLAIRAAAAYLGRALITETIIPFTQDEIFLIESLDDRHIKKIKDMQDTSFSVKKIHDEVFGEGIKHQDVPYSREDEEKITSHNYSHVMNGHSYTNQHYSQVNNHLHRNGYEITDYVGGFAKKKDDENAREEKIGKILTRTGANQEMTNIIGKPKYKTTTSETGNTVHARDRYGRKIIESEGKPLSIAQAFANDPIRAAKKDVKLVVTRSKEGVAGMSTGKGWNSCMNLDDGSNRHYVPKEIQNGTLTAYLVRKDDTDFDNPVGRVNLKQFESSTGHKIWRPETSSYGSMPKSAVTALHHWSETRYPHHEDEIYSKNSELYNDDGKTTRVFGNPEFQKLQTHYSNHISDIMSSHSERRDEFYNKHGFHNEDDDVSSEVHSFLNSLPENHKNNLIIHSNLTQQDDTSEKYDEDKNSDDHIADWANRKSYDVKSLTDKELANHLKTAEDATTEDYRYDSNELSNATQTHAKLIGEAMRRGDAALKDNAIHHIVNTHKSSEWYDNMNEEDSHHIPHLHAHTKNSNLLKSLYEIGKEGTINNIISDVDDMGGNERHEFGKLIGKHGDNDFLNEFAKTHYNDHIANDHHAFISGFHKGLNERPDGEEIQHHLIGELNLGGGHTERGELKGIHDEGDLEATKNPYFPQFAYHQGSEHPGNNELYANMAYYTKHPSVHQALKTRNDTQTPEIQDAIKKNEHGLGK